MGSEDQTLVKLLLKSFPKRLLTAEHACLPSLLSILRIYSSNITAEDLYYKTEAILVQERSNDINEHVVDQLKSNLQREWEAKAKLASTSSRPFATPAPKVRNAARIGSMLGVTPQTPQSASSSIRTNGTETTPSTPLPVQHPRIIETLNAHITSTEETRLQDLIDLKEDSKANFRQGNSRVALAIGSDPRSWNYRYMFEKPGAKGQVLNDEIENILESILESYHLHRDDIADPSVTSQESVYVVGRIGCHQVRGEGKTARLHDGMIIEASKLIGSGSRTTLRFSNRVTMRGVTLPGTSGSAGEVPGDVIMHTAGNGKQLGLFPGLIAGFRGRNGGGDAFVVEEVLMPTALPHAASDVVDLLQHQHSPVRLDGEPLQLQVASGPFTSDSSLDFEAWHHLMDQVERTRPDVILLLGPFLSAQHPRLQDPDLAELPQDIFQRHISARLNKICELTSRTTAILLPSTKDIVSPHAAWPQPMFDKASLGIHKRVKCLPNPCLFSINEVVLGATTVDVLRDLKSQEMVMQVDHDSSIRNRDGDGNQDAMARSIRHLFHQRNFYPIFPTPSEVPLDITHSHLAHLPAVTPDVLLVPSVLTPFARIVDGTVVVNPGMCSKGSQKAMGTYASFQIQPMKQETLREHEKRSEINNESVKLSHAIYDRARVDIYRM